jgi:ornithine carbamoyltransferase
MGADRSRTQTSAQIAETLKRMRGENIATKVFNSGLGVSIFRDNSTRTRFSYASALNLLGLAQQDLDEGKSQIAHGETVRETANMIAFCADAIGIRDDMYLGAGNAYMREVGAALDDGFAQGVLPPAPGHRQPAVRHRPPDPVDGRPGMVARTLWQP